MLQPKPRFFRKVNRKIIRHTYENKSNFVAFGIYGIQALEYGFLTPRQIEAVRRTITSRLKRQAKVWIRAYPDYPRTAKPKEVRIGRGKGNVDRWVCYVKPGRILFEASTRNAQKVSPKLVQNVLLWAMRKLPVFAQVVPRARTL